MKEPIYTQNLVIWYGQAANGCQMLTYSPQALTPDAPLSPIVKRRTDWSRISQAIVQIHFQVQDLLGRAVYDKPRDDAGVERAAHTLSSYVLPPDGFSSLLQPGAQPCLDIGGDDAMYIPWETLEESCYVCPKCGQRTSPLNPPVSIPVFCSRDGTEMKSEGGKLVLNYHFAHVVRSRGTCAQRGKTFLLVKDPLGDLCTRNGIPVPVVDDHIQTLERLLTQNGFTVKILAHSMATCSRFLNWISNPDLAGIYYFGHGLLQEDVGESALVLHDGKLKASDIENAGSSASFVFLNACEAGAVPLKNAQDDGISIASAFALGGPNRAVIAPIFPIETRQGADAALTFFRQAVVGTTTTAECLQAVRMRSVGLYNDKNLPDTRWFSYRYFGDPNCRLLSPSPGIAVGDTGDRGIVERVFDENERIAKAAFGFPVDAIFLRAAKRRNMRQRKRVNIEDLIAGLIRKGDLTRFVLKESRLDPDAIYTNVLSCEDSPAGDASECGAPAVPSVGNGSRGALKLRELMARFIINEKNDLDPAVIAALTGADQCAQRRNPIGQSGTITELDLLSQIVSTSQWEHLRIAGLPGATTVHNAMALRESMGIDENGVVLLNDLDIEARRIIHDAHKLAQQRGVFPITNRVFLAALFERTDGYASRLCQAGSAPLPPSVLRRIIRATIDDNEHSKSFGLSREACSRIVTAVLDSARRLAVSAESVAERDIFRAYCDSAPPALKLALKNRLYLDLDRLKSLEIQSDAGKDSSCSEQPVGNVGGHDNDFSDFDDTCRRIIEQAVEFARRSGKNCVNSPHLFAAMIECGTNALASVTRTPGKGAALRDMVLSMMQKGPGPLGKNVEVAFSTHTREILERARHVARSSHRCTVTDDDLVVSFFADGGGVIGRMLTLAGLKAFSLSDSAGPIPAGPLFGLN
jgi:histone H3/H4